MPQKKNKTSVFLSVDFDFWNYCPNNFYQDISFLIQLGKKYKIPITAVTNHQQMLRYIDKDKARVLINLDTHNDIITKDSNIFDCGSWVSYVKWRKDGTYLWIHAGPVCEGDVSAFRGGNFYDFRDPLRIDYTHTDWKLLKRIPASLYRLKMSSILKRYLSQISFISFCVSPAYTEMDLQKLGKALLKTKDIPILRGRKDEDNYGVEREVPNV